MEKLTLTPSQASQYFQYIFSKEQSGEKFPVDFDECWLLVYKQRSHALRELKKSFIENEDFYPKMDKTSANGRPTKKMFLSVSCLEYFIVRKVREVFEVYRNLRQQYHSGKLAQLSEDEQLLIQQFRKAKHYQGKYIREKEAHHVTMEKLLDTQLERDRYEDALYDEIELRRIAHRWFPIGSCR